MAGEFTFGSQASAGTVFDFSPEVDILKLDTFITDFLQSEKDKKEKAKKQAQTDANAQASKMQAQASALSGDLLSSTMASAKGATFGLSL